MRPGEHEDPADRREGDPVVVRLPGQLQEPGMHVDVEAPAREQEGDPGEGAGGLSAEAAGGRVAAGAGRRGEEGGRRGRACEGRSCCFVQGCVIVPVSRGSRGVGLGLRFLGGFFDSGDSCRVVVQAGDGCRARDVKGDADEGVVGGASGRRVVGGELEGDLRE